MRKTVLAILCFTALSLMSCLLVVNEDDDPCENTDDADTITVVLSRIPAGSAMPLSIGR